MVSDDPVSLDLRLRGAVTDFVESGTPIPADLVLDAAESLHRENETRYDALLADYNLVRASRDKFMPKTACEHTKMFVSHETARLMEAVPCAWCEIERLRECLSLIADGATPADVASDAARAALRHKCATCNHTGRVTDSEGVVWPCYERRLA